MRQRHCGAVWGLAVFAALVPCTLGAQSIGGQVSDEGTNATVGGVTVTLLDSAGVVHAQQTTGDDGRFNLSAPGPGKYRLRFQVPGYRLLVTPLLSLVAGQELSYPLTLRPLAPAVLDTLLVEGRPVPWNLVAFYQRKQRGLGNFITRDEWERQGFFEVSAAVRWANPFVLLPNAGRGTIRSCTPRVFLDGLPVAADTNDVSLVLNHLSLYHLAAIEVHRSPTVPPEFDYPFGACAVVALWSSLEMTGRTAHLDLGAHAGTAVAGAAGGRGRAGVQAAIGLVGPLELYGAFNAILSALDPGSVLPRSGWEIVASLRARPLGRESGWYVGVGGRAGGLRATPVAPSTEEQDLVVLSGLELPVGRIRPFVELQVLGPQSPGSAILTGFVGASARLY